MYPWFLVFLTVFLKNRNTSSKIKRSKVTDYAALKEISPNRHLNMQKLNFCLLRFFIP